MRKKFFSRGFFGLALLMLFGLTLPTWGQTSSEIYTKTETQLLKDQITDGKFITLKASDTNNNKYLKGNTAGSDVFAGAMTTFKVEFQGDNFRLKNVGQNKYIKKPTNNNHQLVTMTSEVSEAALFTATTIAKTAVSNWTTQASGTPENLVRFTAIGSGVPGNCLLNCNHAGSAMKWFHGTGGFSVFIVYEVTKSNYTFPAFDETKAFRVITNDRGVLIYDAGQGKLRTQAGEGDDNDINQKFAIVADGTSKYLYSYGAQKFVASNYYRKSNRLTPLPLYTVTKSNAQTPMDNYAYKLQLTGGGNTSYINLSEGNVTIDHWTTEDEGNRFYLKNIEETVDQATILKDAYNAAITEAKAQNYTDGITSIVEGTDLTTAKNNWNTLKTNARLKSGFYRIKGASGKYVTAGATGQRLQMNSTQTDDAIFYYNGETEHNLVALKNGYSIYDTWSLGNASQADALEIRVVEPNKYTVKSLHENKYLYDNNTAELERVMNYHENSDFELFAVTEIPVTLHNGEATFYTPVAVSVSEGTTAYKGSVSGSTLTLTALNGTIPANTPFFLKGTGENCTLTVTTGGETIGENAFKGSVKTRTQTSGKSTYVLSNAEFKLLGEGVNCRGFRAQVETETNSGVQGFTLEFDNITAIESVETPTDNTPVFDLSGRRVAKTVKGGIYLRNGKKFVQ